MAHRHVLRIRQKSRAVNAHPTRMFLGYLCGESPAFHGFTGNRMPLPKIEPLIESVALIEVQSLVLEEKLVVLPPVPPHAALPNRIAVVGNYLPRRCGIARLDYFE